MTELLYKIFVKSNDLTNNKTREKCGTLGSVVGIIANIFLCAVKMSVGIFSGSMSILADGLNNLSDMGSSVITMIGFKLSNRPEDSDHPFGHGRMEYISAFIVSVLIILVGFELVSSSVKALIAGDTAPRYGTLALVILGISVAVKLWMFFFNRKLGKKIDSSALLATAQDSLNDAVATTAIFIAAIFSVFVKIPFNLDAVMAAGVGLFILWSGIASAKDTMDEILGGPPDEKLVKDIENSIMSFEGFLGIHDLIVHNYGPGRQFASVHVEVPQNVDIVECHERIDLCEKYVGEKCGISLVIHMDPIDSDNTEVTETRERMSAMLKLINGSLTLHDFRMTPKAENRTNLIFDVVVPSNVKIPEEELLQKIRSGAKTIDKTFECVVTFDNSYV